MDSNRQSMRDKTECKDQLEVKSSLQKSKVNKSKNPHNRITGHDINMIQKHSRTQHQSKAESRIQGNYTI